MVEVLRQNCFKRVNISPFSVVLFMLNTRHGDIYLHSYDMDFSSVYF